MNKEDLLEVVNKAVSLSKADQVEALLVGGESYLTGFANNYIHRNVGEETYELSVRVVIGKKVASASTTDLSYESIKSCVETAETLCKFQKDNEEFVSLPKDNGEEKYFEEVYELPDAETRAEIVKKVVDASKKHDLISSGKFEVEKSQIAIKNSFGIEKYGERTVATLKNIAMGDTSSGFSQESAMSFKDINVDKIIEESLDTALKGRSPISIDPGKYEVILSPYAVEEFLSSMKYLSLTEKNIEEGTSFMKGHFGEKMFNDMITIYDDGNDANTIKMAFDFEGMKKKRVYFVKNGVIENVVNDSFYAYKLGKEPTGHSLPQPNDLGAYPMNFIFEKGTSKLDDMISNVEKGLFVQRFWYTNPMDPVNLVITGMTRDGLFLIENGKITKGVKHMRFTESIITALKNCLEISDNSKIIYEGGTVTTAPYMRIKDFNFSSATEF
ncbi:MAG: TldD/PmbA family protein [Caldisericaceae bacterium]